MTGVLCVVAGAASSGVTIQLTTPRTLLFIATGGASAITGYRLSNDGFVYTTAGTSGTYSPQEQWISNTALVGDYQAVVTASGDTPTGTLGTPVVLNTTNSWELTAFPGESFNTQLTVTIRDTATNTTRATAIINLIPSSEL